MNVDITVSDLTVDLHVDCDVHGTCNVLRCAHVRPCILRYDAFKVQAAVTPCERSPIQLNLDRGNNV